MSLLSNKLKKPLTRKVPVPELGKDFEIIIRKRVVGDHVRFYHLLEMYGDENGNIDIASFNLIRLMSCMVDEEGNYITNDDDLPSLLSHLGMETYSTLLAVCDELNPVVGPKELDEKKTES